MSRIRAKSRKAAGCSKCSKMAEKDEKRESPTQHLVRAYIRGTRKVDPRQMSLFAAPREPSSASLYQNTRIPPTRWDLRTFPGSVCPPEQGYPTLFEPRSWHPYRGGWGQIPPYRGYGCQRKRGKCRG